MNKEVLLPNLCCIVCCHLIKQNKKQRIKTWLQLRKGQFLANINFRWVLEAAQERVGKDDFKELTTLLRRVSKGEPKKRGLLKTWMQRQKHTKKRGAEERYRQNLLKRERQRLEKARLHRLAAWSLQPGQGPDPYAQ